MTPEPEQAPNAALAFREFAEDNSISLVEREDWWAWWECYYDGWIRGQNFIGGG